MEDATSVSQFLELFADFTEDVIKGDTATDSDIMKSLLMLWCFKNHYNSGESVEKSKSHGMDPKLVPTIYEGLLSVMKPKVRNEYKALCKTAAKERSQQQRKLEDATRVREFLDVLAAQSQQSNKDVEYQQVLLQCVQRYSSLEETVGELSKYTDHTQACILIHSLMMKMKNEVKAEYQSLCKRTTGSDTEKVPPMFPVVASTSSNEDSIHQILLATMNETMKQLDEKMQKTVQQMRELYNTSQMNMQTSLKEFLNTEFDPKFRKTITERFAVLGPAIGKKAFSDLEKAVSQQLDEQKQKTVQQMREICNSSQKNLQTYLTEFLNTEFDPKFRKSIDERFAALGPAIGKAAFSDVGKAVSQLEESFSSKVKEGNKSISEQLSQLESALSAPQRLTHELADSQKDLPSKNLQALSKLISEEKYEESFSWALHCKDASTVSWLCSQVNMDDLPLSQRVRCGLLLELTTNLKENTSDKLKWIGHLIFSIKAGVTTQEVTLCLDLVKERLYWYIKEINLHKFDAMGLLPSLAGPFLAG